MDYVKRYLMYAVVFVCMKLIATYCSDILFVSFVDKIVWNASFMFYGGIIF